MTELIIWTQYEIQVAAYNGAGLGVFSRAVTEYTLQGGEPPRGGTVFFAGEQDMRSSLGASELKYFEIFQLTQYLKYLFLLKSK